MGLRGTIGLLSSAAEVCLLLFPGFFALFLSWVGVSCLRKRVWLKRRGVGVLERSCETLDNSARQRTASRHTGLQRGLEEDRFRSSRCNSTDCELVHAGQGVPT